MNEIIIDANGTEYTETKDILKCQNQFYKSLYDKVHTPEKRSINDFLEENQQKLSDDTAQKKQKEKLHIPNYHKP